jgi:hypothetical protein
MIKFDLSEVQDGWAQANISAGGEELVISASYTPTDSIRDFVDAVASLQTSASAHCCWFQEPGEMHWQFLRSERNVEVKIIHFGGVRMPKRHGPEGNTVFKADAEWLHFARQVLRALETVRGTLGIGGYEREWRHPFPREACDKLESAIRLETSRFS